MIMLMAVGGRMIMPLSTWVMDIPAEEGEVSGAVAGEAATVASLITNRMVAIMMRHLFLLQSEVGNFPLIMQSVVCITRPFC